MLSDSEQHSNSRGWRGHVRGVGVATGGNGLGGLVSPPAVLGQARTCRTVGGMGGLVL